tara:strand:- start:699 stop:1673 length:975 start_codon:yes stop_codon:yes gene_type:complete
MKNRYNAGIIILAARTKILKKTLNFFYENWNQKYDYPIYLHTFGKIIPKPLIDEINKDISKNIFVKEIDYGVPEHINEKDLFYNRSYNDYVKSRFPKKRIGYLHMLRFATNITSFGDKGCFSKEMEKFDYLLKFDDESWFKKKIDYDLFDILNEHCMATAYADGDGVPLKIKKETTENIWEFYKSYLKKFKYEPKNSILKDALKKDDGNLIYRLQYKCGNCEFYNIPKILKYPIKEYLDYANLYGGDYKYRWGDNEVLGLFAYTHFDRPFYDYEFKKKDIYYPSLPSIYTDGFAPSPNDKFNVNNSLVAVIFFKIRKLLKKIFK